MGFNFKVEGLSNDAIFGLSIERPILDHHPKAHVHEIRRISYGFHEIRRISYGFHEIRRISYGFHEIRRISCEIERPLQGIVTLCFEHFSFYFFGHFAILIKLTRMGVISIDKY